MSEHSSETDTQPRRRRRWPLFTFAALGVVVLLVVVVGVVWFEVRSTDSSDDDSAFQDTLSDFYASPDAPPAPGEVVRIEPIANFDVPGGTAYRMLYGTQAPDDSAAISSGMLFVPNSPAPAGGRPVLAWAHGTLGFGDECTPSRRYEPTTDNLDFGSWLSAALDRGWVVTATDYTGIGTDGDPYYLIASSEARDVLNSVRAARNVPDAAAGTRFATFGHSQGGHASLAAAMSADYAPELQLVAAAAAAPAAELGPLIAQQWDQSVAWAIGPSVALSWPLVYPDLPLDSVLGEKAMKDYKSLADGCLSQEADQFIVDRAEGAQFFETDPTKNADWIAAITDQTIDVDKIDVPIFLVQSLADKIVLPNTNALLSTRACAEPTPTFDMSWIGVVSHQQTAETGGLLAVDWLQDRFAGVPPSTSCAQMLPIEAAQTVP